MTEYDYNYFTSSMTSFLTRYFTRYVTSSLKSNLTSYVKSCLTSYLTRYLTSYVASDSSYLKLVLKMLPSSCGVAPQSQLFTEGTDPKPANKLLIFFPLNSQIIFFFHFFTSTRTNTPRVTNALN